MTRERRETHEFKATITRATNIARLRNEPQPTPAEIAESRALAGLPIETGRELVLNLLALRKRVPEHTARWYFVNRLISEATAEADREERSALIRGRK